MTTTAAAWFNDVDALVYDAFGGFSSGITYSGSVLSVGGNTVGAIGLRMQVFYSPGVFPSGTTDNLVVESTGTGDAGGTSGHRIVNFRGTVTGTVNASSINALTADGIASLSSGTVTAAVGGGFTARNSGAGALTTAIGVAGHIRVSSTGNITEARAFQAGLPLRTSSGNIATIYGLYVDNQGVTNTTSAHGVFVADQTTATNNYGVRSQVSSGANKWNVYAEGTADNYLEGCTGIGVAASSSAALVCVGSASGKSSIRLPHGTAPSSPVNGDMWTTTAGLFVRVNGATVGPLS